MTQTISLAPGNVIQARRRLWRVDARQGDVLTATAIDGQTDQVQFYIPFEDIQPGELPLPSTEQIGTYQAQQLLLRAYSCPGKFFPSLSWVEEMNPFLAKG